MDKLDLLGWEAHTTVKLGDHAFKIRSTSKAFNAWVGDVLKPYKVRKPSAQTWYSVVIAGGDPDEDGKSKRRFHILYRGSSQVVRTMDLPTLGNALFAELESTMYEDRDDAVYLDAAALSMDGKIALIPGNYLPTLWKLSRRLYQAGIRLPLARTIAVDRETGQVIPTQRELKLPGDAIDSLTGAVGAEAAAILGVAGSRSGNSDHMDRWVLESPTQATAVLTTGAAEEGPRQPQTRGQTVYRLAGMMMNMPKVGASALESLSLLAEKAQCYSFYGAVSAPAQRTQLLNDIAASISGR
jgi:hypothetical protein